MSSKDFIQRHWTVIHNESEIQFESLDAAIWYASGVGSVSKAIRQVNSRLRIITLLPVENLDSSENCQSVCIAA